MAMDEPVPQPGPARISKGGGPDEWLEQAKQCKYLPETEMKRLCEIVKECLMEGTLWFSGSGSLLHGHVSADPVAVVSRRIQHPARADSCDGVRRHPWPVLRPARAVPRRWGHAQLNPRRSSHGADQGHHLGRHRAPLGDHRPEAAAEDALRQRQREWREPGPERYGRGRAERAQSRARARHGRRCDRSDQSWGRLGRGHGRQGGLAGVAELRLPR